MISFILYLYTQLWLISFEYMSGMILMHFYLSHIDICCAIHNTYVALKAEKYRTILGHGFAATVYNYFNACQYKVISVTFRSFEYIKTSIDLFDTLISTIQ